MRFVRRNKLERTMYINMTGFITLIVGLTAIVSAGETFYVQQDPLVSQELHGLPLWVIFAAIAISILVQVSVVIGIMMMAAALWIAYVYNRHGKERLLQIIPEPHLVWAWPDEFKLRRFRNSQ